MHRHVAADLRQRREAVDWLRGQPFAAELIVVDDGSEDATAGIAAEALGGFVAGRVVRIPHGGKAAAVRAGMLAATQEQIAFSDADLATILFAASRAPSGSNRQPFRFVVLRDGPRAREAKRLLAGAGHRSGLLHVARRHSADEQGGGWTIGNAPKTTDLWPVGTSPAADDVQIPSS